MTTPTPHPGGSPIRADVHMHTSHSHGQASTQDMYEAAVKAGLTIIGFSEHSPRPAGYAYVADYQEKLRAGFPQYVAEVQALCERGKEQGVTVLLGLEVDYIAGQEEFAAALCREYPYDYIIGGLHFQGTWGFDGPGGEWAGLNRAARYNIYARYYQDLARMCGTGLFHIAAHPDLVKIHSVAEFRAWLETPEALPLVSTALEAMRDQGMAMEISSAGLRKDCREIYPGPDIMALAAEVGVRISFGADAHCTNTPAYAFDALARYAASYGYKESTIFVGGEPQPLPFTVPDILK